MKTFTWQGKAGFLKRVIFIVPVFLFSFSLGSNAQLSSLITQVTSEQGLSNNGVTCILQDHYGFLWFGTWDGLNKYDGLNTTIFRPTKDGEPGLSHNNISCLYEDSEGFLWIGTKSKGLNRMNLVTGQIDDLSGHEMGIEADWITDIQEDKKGYLWISTENGVYRLDLKRKGDETDVFSSIVDHSFVSDIQMDLNGDLWFASYEGLYHYLVDEEKFYSLNEEKLDCKCSLTNLTSIAIDSSGTLWISTWTEGLIKAVLAKDRQQNGTGEINLFESYNFSRVSLDSYIDPSEFRGVYRVYVDSRNILWLALWGKGVLQMDLTNNRVEMIRCNYQDAYSLSNNYVLSIFEDESGLIWIGTDDGGVNKINVEANPFYTYTREFGNDFGRIGPILQTSDHILFVGTRDAGLFFTPFYSDRFKGDQTLNFMNLVVGRDAPEGISYREITTLFEDANNNLWIGTTVGLDMISKENRSSEPYKIRKYYHDPVNLRSLSDDNITHICEDANGVLWVGTMEHGLNRLDSMDQSQELYFSSYFPIEGDSSSLSHYRIRTLFEDRDGIFWIGTDGGLGRRIENEDSGEDEFKTIYSERGESRLSDNSIICLNEDHEGNLWVGTTNGLNILSREHKLNEKAAFTLIGMEDGLPGNFILSILFDNNKDAWITTNRGLAKISTSNGKISTFNKSDGLAGNIFSDESAFRNKEGYLFFGDINGLNIFDPGDIRPYNYIPKVMLLAIHTKSSDPDAGLSPEADNSLLNKESIKLNYTQKNFTIEFVSLCFIAPEKNKYQYILEGFDEQWVQAGSRNYAVYTNIPPGKYTFRLKGSNGNGTWNPKESQVQIRITPPWWASPVSFFVYLILIFLLVFGLTRINMNQVKLKNELLVEKLENDKNEALNRAKLKFFTNISHEFRTPLTLILISLNKLGNGFQGERSEVKSIQLIQRNANLLLRLVNQIMDLRKIENKRMEIKPGKYDLVGFVSRIYEALVPLAEEKKIKYTFHSELEELMMFYDHSMMEKVYWNILSNAFKYTPLNGAVQILILETYIGGARYIRTEIQDDGPGISPEELDKVFDRFYQAGLRNSPNLRGTGIGLSIAKEMVELNHGSIEVQSAKQKGTCFAINLPVENPDLEKISEEIIVPAEYTVDPREFFADAQIEIVSERNEIPTDTYDKPLLLIVEDNQDLLFVLRDAFAGSFRIETAVDGKEGFEIATETLPDMIVSDVAMPEMNGLQLCEKLKSDVHTSHIPIILLTAKTSVEVQLQGLKLNADDYITKPFDLKVLEARIRNLMRERKYLKDKYRNMPEIDTKQLELNPTDQRFLDKSVYIIEKNMSDYKFSIEDFAHELGMSRSSLYRKIHALTGQSAKEFIRDIRIKKAARLLEQGDRTVSEVAFEVGFISRSYFARCFNECFNVTPSKYFESKQKT